MSKEIIIKRKFARFIKPNVDPPHEPIMMKDPDTGEEEELLTDADGNVHLYNYWNDSVFTSKSFVRKDMTKFVSVVPGDLIDNTEVAESTSGVESDKYYYAIDLKIVFCSRYAFPYFPVQDVLVDLGTVATAMRSQRNVGATKISIRIGIPASVADTLITRGKAIGCKRVEAPAVVGDIAWYFCQMPASGFTMLASDGGKVIHVPIEKVVEGATAKSMLCAAVLIAKLKCGVLKGSAEQFTPKANALWKLNFEIVSANMIEQVEESSGTGVTRPTDTIDTDATPTDSDLFKSFEKMLL